MSLLLLKCRLNLKEEEINFLNMFTTFPQSISYISIQSMFKNHFNKNISLKTIIGYFNYIKVKVNIDYDIHFACDYEPPKLKYCQFNKEQLKDKKFCKKNCLIIDVLQLSIKYFNCKNTNSISNTNIFSNQDIFEFQTIKIFMLIACCNGKILHCTTYINFNDIYQDLEPMYSKLCKYHYKFSNKNSKFIFILGPSLPCTKLLFDSLSNSHNLELSDCENNIINVLPKNESTRVESQYNTTIFSDTKININYILSKGHSVITGKFNTSPYTIPLFEIASFWKNYMESKLKHCKHIKKILYDSQFYIQKHNFKKYFKKFPAIS